MQQAVDAFFNLDERAKIGELAHSPFYHRSGGVTIRPRGPGIRFELLDAERNTPVPRLNVQHHRFHLIAGFHHFAGMLHPAAPGHLRDMDQTFHAWLQLDESAVVGDAYHAPNHARTLRITFLDGFPRVWNQLPETE